MDTVESIEKVLEPVLSAEGIEAVDIKVGRHGTKTIIQCFLEKIEGRISIDDCAKMSEKIEAALDFNNIIQGHYVLEVSSPGIDRVIKKEADFIKFTGQRARIRLKTPFEESRTYYGALAGFSDGCVVISDSARTYKFALQDIEEARLSPV